MLETRPRALIAVLAALVVGCGQPFLGPVQPGSSGRFAVRSQDLERASALERAMDPHLFRKGTRDNTAKLHIDGASGFGAVRDLIRSAKKSLWVEMFIWHNDPTGIEMAHLLRKRALEGLDVRVLIDAAGSKDKDGDRQVLRALHDYQIPVRYFNPYIVKGANVWVTHRKLILADGHHAITGGMNVGGEYEHDWHDLLVELRGSVARQMHAEFASGWNLSGDGPPEELVIPQVPAPPRGQSPARLAITSPFGPPERKHELKKSHWAALRAAKNRIRSFHIYLSDPDYVAELQAALARKVEVELLVPTDNDFESFKYVNRHWAGKLFDSGATVRLYDRRFSHVKYLSIDGAWISLGSANADSRSFYENEELNVVVTDPAFVHEADRRIFENDWSQSRVPSYDDLRVPLRWKPVVTLAQLLAYYL